MWVWNGREYVYIESQRQRVAFGGNIPTNAILTSGAVSFILTKMLGATLPGAIAMGIGGALWEAGSGGIPFGWRRYVLGLFQKPEA